MGAELRDWRAREVRALEALAGKPYVGNEKQWQRFLSEQGLTMEYLGGIRQVIDGCKWKWKDHPLAWVRKASKCMSLAQFGLQGETYEKYARQEVKTRKASVGGVPVFTEGTRGGQRDEYEIKPSLMARSGRRRLQKSTFDGDAMDYFTEKYSDDEYTYAVLNIGRFQLQIPGTITKDDGSGRPDWGKFADRFNLDAGGRLVLFCRLSGIGREEFMAMQSADKDRLWFQAAWRKFDRRMERAAKFYGAWKRSTIKTLMSMGDARMTNSSGGSWSGLAHYIPSQHRILLTGGGQAAEYFSIEPAQLQELVDCGTLPPAILHRQVGLNYYKFSNLVWSLKLAKNRSRYLSLSDALRSPQEWR